MTRPEPKSLETILLVEDKQVVRDAVREILERAGFCVLATGSGGEAIQLERIFNGTIHLLLSYVKLPDRSGPIVAQLLKNHRPEMRVMLMYPDGDMLFLNYGWQFIEKPFLPAFLVDRVNDILHSPLRSQGEDYFDTRIKSKAPGTEA